MKPNHTKNDTKLSQPLFQIWPEALIFLSREASITQLNQAAANMLGWPQDELIGKSAHEVLCASVIGFDHDIEQCPLSFGDKDSEFEASFEGLWRKKDETYLPVEVRRIPIAITQDDKIALVLSFKDSSHKQYTENELERLAHFAILSPNFMFEVDTGQIIHFANPAAVELMANLDFAEDGRPLCWPAETDVYLQQCIELKTPIRNIEYKVNQRFFSWEFHPGNAETEQRIYIYGIEITQQKSDEQELAAHRANLRDIVRNLVRNQTRDLQHHKEEAESANRAKSNFLTNISHEVRTPMNGIIGTAQLLAEQDIDGESKKLVQALLNSSNALAELLTSMIDYSKVVEGRLISDVRAFKLRDLINNCVAMIQYQANEKNNKLFINIHPTVPDDLLGDAHHLREIILVLLNNAVKFTQDGNIHLDIHLVHETETGITLKVSVADTGCGINPENLQLIFRPFTQVDDSTSKKFGGSGLGLALARELAHLNGGSITVESQSGVGSIFIATYQLEKQSETHIQKPARTKPISECKVGVLNTTGDDTLLKTLRSWQIDSQSLAIEKIENQNQFDVMFVSSENLSQALASLTHTTLLLEIASSHQENSLPGIVGQVTPASLYDTLLTQFKYSNEVKSPLQLNIPKGNGEHILLVEDNEVNRMIASTMLKRLNYNVTCAENGYEGLRLFQSKSFQLILMDCQMPEMDGYEATRAIRAIESNKASKTPIIAVTANARLDDRQHCFNMGMDDFVSKPIQAEKMAAVIKAWINLTN